MIPSPSWKAFSEKASEMYHNQLTPEGIEYLTGPERGLTEETIERFRLGLVVDPVPGHEHYQGMISIPYLTTYGVVSLRFRRFGEGDGKKYLTMPGDPPRIYNVSDLELGTRGVCLTEGEFDCMVAVQCGLPCIGLPGAQSWKSVMGRLLDQYDQVMLLQDDDDAGRKMADKLSKSLRNLRPVVMTGGDVTSFFVDNGAEALRRKVLG